MRLLHLFALISALLLGSPAALHAQANPDEQSILASREGDILAVLQGKRAASEVFNQTFIQAVPPQRLAAIISQIEAQHGKLTGAEPGRALGPGTAQMTLHFQRADAAAVFELDADFPRRVSGLRILAIETAAAKANTRKAAPAITKSAAEEAAALPGKVGYLVARLDQGGPVVIEARQADQLFAIGSAFKLWVLDAVAEEVAKGHLSWSQVVPLGPRSLPSGITQDWPAGTPMTVQSLAILMISISDNTATDTLIRLVGRDKVEARVRASGHAQPGALHPFLTTSEAFRLKLAPPAAREAYVLGQGDARLKAVTALPAGIDITSADLAALASGKPVAIDSIEWFASPSDLARVLDLLRRRGDSQVLAILETSTSRRSDIRQGFSRVGYKGGSETGVLNYSWLLQRPSGPWYVVTVSWNNPAAAVDQSRLEALALRLFEKTT